MQTSQSLKIYKYTKVWDGFHASPGFITTRLQNKFYLMVHLLIWQLASTLTPLMLAEPSNLLTGLQGTALKENSSDGKSYTLNFPRAPWLRQM